MKLYFIFFEFYINILILIIYLKLIKDIKNSIKIFNFISKNLDFQLSLDLIYYF